MIEITIERSGGSTIRITSRGHATVSTGAESAPCAAVSVLLKAFGLTLIDHGCTVTGSVDSPGHFDLTCTACEDSAWLRGVSEVIIAAIRSTQATWPDQVRVTIHEE